MSANQDIASARSAEIAAGVRILSFDVEEYFQVEAAGCISRKNWPAMEKRLPACVDRILSILDEHDSTATFFVLGWVARHEPQVVRRIVRAGHEIACHGMDHRMLTTLSSDDLRGDLEVCKGLLENLAGRKVVGYRAATFSLTRSTAWAIDVLAEAGFEYDSSVFPIMHDRYGVPEAPPREHVAVGPAGRSLLEVPPLTVRWAGVNWPAGGGGYFRLLPWRATAWAIESAARSGRAAMIYLHPWELDPAQPLLDMPPAATLRHRLNLSRTEGKLRRLLERFRFTSAAACLARLRRSACEKFLYCPAPTASLSPAPLREKSNASGVL